MATSRPTNRSEEELKDSGSDLPFHDCEDVDPANEFQQLIQAQKEENLRDCRTYTAAITRCRGSLTFFNSPEALADSHKYTRFKTALGMGTLFGLICAINERNVLGGVVTGFVLMTAVIDLFRHAANNYGAQEEHMHTIDPELAKEYESRYMKLG